MKKNASIILIFSVLISFSQERISNLLIGTYTNSCNSTGIYLYNFNSDSGDFKKISVSEKAINPSFLTVSDDRKYIYSVNENGAESTISVYEYKNSNSLNLIEIKKAYGTNPCYIINDNQTVITANYTSGNIVVFKKNEDGSLSNVKQIVQHFGKGINPKRQEKPHVHMVQFTPDKKFVIANDLGTDKMYVYKYNPNSDKDILTIKDSIQLKDGSGPRHSTFSKDGKYCYLLQELDGTLTIFNYNDGIFKKIQEKTIVKPNFEGENAAADLHITPDGKFLYATNRGTFNDISCFEIQKNGLLVFKHTTSTTGKGPRNFAIDPTGNFVLIAHQNTNNITVFKIDKTTGNLTDSGRKLELCAPVCLVFIE